ncbi:MAG TPA: winged helix-turn-helix domain-containing protein [Rudaea sp.]|nr:winged helix-turn-helix domain-containing protein [Rudaea sp.]
MNAQVAESDPNLIAPENAVAPAGWRAGNLVVDLALRRVSRDGERVPVQEMPLRLLCLLLERGGRPISRRELHETLWPRYGWDSVERNLNTAVRKLRRAIGDDARPPILIETLRANGYRWIGPAPQALAASALSSVAAPVPNVARRFLAWGASALLVAGLAIGVAAIALDADPFASERLLAEAAGWLPSAAPDSALPASAQRDFADAGSLLSARDPSRASVERAVALLDGVLHAAPAHTGALRLYARAERRLALLQRDPAAARDRRLAAREALRRALRIDPGSAALAVDAAAQLYWGEWNGRAAARWFDLARREAPRDAAVLEAYAWFALAERRTSEAVDTMHAALAAAPADANLHSNLGWFYFRTGSYADALRQCRLALEIDAANASAQTCEERSLAESGRMDEAWRALRGHAPAWLAGAEAARLDGMPAEQAYRAAMHLAAADVRIRLGKGYFSACLEAIAGDRVAMAEDLAAAVAMADPGLRLAPVTPELVRLMGIAEARGLADRVPSALRDRAG